jgi:DNA invertase Pin-like site-specific DNA recombinase
MPEKNPQNRRLGYARVSTYGQTLAAQLEQLRAAGCATIYREKVTGAWPDRRELLKLLKATSPGDVVTVTWRRLSSCEERAGMADTASHDR